MNSAREAAAFDRQVDRWVHAAVLEGVSSFDDLVCRLPGVYPSAVANSLDRLLHDGAIAHLVHRVASKRDSVFRLPAPSPGSAVLPPAHPLDFDWRYAPAAIEELLARVVDATEPGDTIALLGTPSLYLAASQRGLGRRFVLIDESSVTLDSLAHVGDAGSLVRLDLITDRVPDLAAAAVVADPPWYPEHIEAFLWSAATCARPGARVFISLPGVGTRPGGRRERSEFRRRATAQGLECLRTAPGTLAYLSPCFEINALRAAGLQDLPMDWRRGDLVVLESRGKPQVRQAWPSGEPSWEERRVGWVRIRARNRQTAGVDPALKQLVDGDVLSDVSRRHPLRKQVVVWTSGNRVYGCDSPDLLLVILDAVARGVDPNERVTAVLGRSLTSAERAKVMRAARQSTWIARVEAQELARLGWATLTASERVAS
jgi:hypothetical protein